MSSALSGQSLARRTPPALESLDEDQRGRRARIVEAAVSLMFTIDYERIQVKEVSAAAGVALGTTYRYFTSKEHLFAEALLAWADRFPIAGIPAASGQNVDQLKAAFRHAARAFERHPKVHGTLEALQASTDPIASALFERFAIKQNEAFARYLPRIASPRRQQIIAVMDAVLDANLRAWTMGRQPIEDVYRSLDVAADLLVGRERTSSTASVPGNTRRRTVSD